MKLFKTGRIFGALILTLALILIPAYSATALGPPTITSMYVATTPTWGNDQAAGNNGTTNTVTVTGTNLAGVTGLSFYQGATLDPMITVSGIASNTDIQFRVNVIIAPEAAAGPRNLTVTALAGTSAAFTAGFMVYRASASIDSPAQVSQNGTFNVAVNVNNVANLNAFQFDLSFDPAVIQVNGEENLSGVTDGVIHGLVVGDKGMPVTGWTWRPEAGITSGTIRVVGQLGAANRSVTGSGTLATVNFSVLGAAGTNTALTLSGVLPINSFSNSIAPDSISNASVSVAGFVISTSSLPEATIGVAYAGGILNAAGGTPPYTWSAAGLPGGMTIGATTGIISGAPNASGPFSVNFTATDSALPTHNSISKLLPLTVYSALQVDTAVLPSANINKSYTAPAASASGGKLNYSWSASGLPNGLSMSTAGVISGTPTQSGVFNVVLTVTDSFSPANTATATVPLQVNGVLQITTTSLPSGVAGSNYSTPVTAGGGQSPYSWTATGLPSGLTMNASTGVISGIPATANNYVVNISVSDSFNPANTANTSLALLIGTGAVITTTSLPEAVQNAGYSAAVSAAGGVAPYTWSATGLPAGLTISSSTGIISGIPTAVPPLDGNYTVVVSLVDSGLVVSNPSKTLTLHVYPALTVATDLLHRWAVEVYTDPLASWLPLPVPGWIVGRPYSSTLAAAGGKGAYTWSASGLPAGLTMSAAGVISGTPTQTGVFDITCTVTDSFSPANTASKVLKLKIYKIGDANGDGNVTVADVTIVERVLLGLNPPTAGCDGNFNGVISIGDVTRIERIILGIP